MQTDIFIPARLDSKRLPSKHLKEINNIPIIMHLVNRLKNCQSIKNIIVCTTTSPSDDILVQYLKQENIQFFRGSEFDILQRFLNAANEFNTDIIIDVEADKIYTDPKYVEQISHEMNNSDIDFMTGNNSLDTLDPEFVFHGFIPAGIKVKALKRICELKKTNNTETGYKEFFTSNNFIKTKFLIPQTNLSIKKNFRFTIDYPEDFELAKIIFSNLGTHFDTEQLLKYIEKNSALQEIINPIIKKWKENYEQNIIEFRLNQSD
jgi:spore coat polysaccharide biosynthesis protein SpsF